MSDVSEDKVRELVASRTPEELARAYLRASRRATQAQREAEEAKAAVELLKMFKNVTIRK